MTDIVCFCVTVNPFSTTGSILSRQKRDDGRTKFAHTFGPCVEQMRTFSANAMWRKHCWHFKKPPQIDFSTVLLICVIQCGLTEVGADNAESPSAQTLWVVFQGVKNLWWPPRFSLANDPIGQLLVFTIAMQGCHVSVKEIATLLGVSQT